MVHEAEKELEINLVPPTEPPRVGEGKGHMIASDKTRFLVIGPKRSFKVFALKPQKLETASEFYKLPQDYVFCGKQRFGVITNVTTNKENVREVICDTYEVEETGDIVLQTDSQNENPKVFLVKDTVANAIELKPKGSPKVFNENNLSCTEKGKIPEHFKVLLDEFEMMK